MKIQTEKNSNDPVTIKEWIELIEFIGGHFATKDDLDRFATKDDLDRFATKDDLDRFATKDDLDELRIELKSDIGNIKEDVRQIMEKSEDNVLKMRSDILKAKDEIVREIKTMREEQIMHAGVHKIVTDETEHLKKRVTNIEYRVGIDPALA